DAAVQALLHPGVEALDRPGRPLALRDDLLGRLGIRALDLHDRAQEALQPEAVAAGEGGLALGHGGEREELELGRGEEARVARDHDPEEGRARAGGREEEERRRVLHLARQRYRRYRRPDDVTDQGEPRGVDPHLGTALPWGGRRRRGGPEPGHRRRVLA